MSLRKMGMKCLAVLGVLFGTVAAHAEEVTYASMNDANFVSRVEALEAELASLRSNLGDGGGCASKGDDGCGCYDSGVIVGAELLLLTPHTGSLQVLGGPTVTGQYGVQAAPRIWVGYRNAEGLGVRARYFSFDGDSGASTLGLFQNLHMEAIDAEVTQVEYLGKWVFDLSMGARWAQDRNALYTVPAAAAPAFGVALQDFQGAGGTIALGAWRPLGGRNLSLFLNTRASLLYGQNTYAAAVVVPQVPVPLVGAFKSEDEVVAVYEMQLGLEYSRQMDNGNRFYARAAFEGQVWNIPSPALGLGDDTTGLAGVAFAMGFNR